MFRFIFLILTAVALSSAQDDTKLKLSFYITSQCRDTINFVTRQLYPLYQDLGSYMDVEFIPWGKSRREETGIVCQFGPTDCVANKIQSCVLHLLEDNQEKQVEYINCEMENLFAPQENYQCANDVGISTEAAQECYESGLGDELQADAEEKTGTIVMVFVPTIVLDDVYDVDNQNSAFSNFKGFVCGLLEDKELPACN